MTLGKCHIIVWGQSSTATINRSFVIYSHVLASQHEEAIRTLDQNTASDSCSMKCGYQSSVVMSSEKFSSLNFY